MTRSWTRGVGLLLVGTLAGPSAALQRTTDGHLASGIALVKAGDFESAIPALSAAIQALNPDLKRRADLAKAYLYLGVAYLELNQELEARGKFREALRNDPKIQLSPQEFSGQVRRVFDAERLAAEPPKKRRNLLLPLVLVVGGSTAVSVGVAAATGGNPPQTTLAATTTTSTTTTPPGGPGSTTTTTTTPPGSTPTTTLPSTTTSTTPSSTTSTTTTSTTTTTTTTTTTMPPCVYSAAPNRNFASLGGNGVCNIDTTLQTCPWTAEVSPAANWLTMNAPTSGVGDGAVSYSVAILNLGNSRAARIRLLQDPSASCAISQDGVLGEPSAPQLSWASQLDLPGGSGQVFVNETDSVSQEGALIHYGRASKGAVNRIEAHVVRGKGPGTWTFEILAGHEPGSLRVLVGRGVLAGPDRVVFQLSGQPGERVAFLFRSAR